MHGGRLSCSSHSWNKSAYSESTGLVGAYARGSRNIAMIGEQQVD
jgi:hypothetical protein